MMGSPLPFLYISITVLYNFGRGHFYFGPFPQIETARFLYIYSYRKIIVNDAFCCEAATAASCESIIVGIDIERSRPMVKYQKQVPEYYKGMYQDGYTPEQILDAIHRKMYR